MKRRVLQSGEPTGRQGIEKYYEERLGCKGKNSSRKIDLIELLAYEEVFTIFLLKDTKFNFNYRFKLQQYGEKLLNNKRGGIVAIEPETGEVLSLVSAPSYDPNFWLED